MHKQSCVQICPDMAICYPLHVIAAAAEQSRTLELKASWYMREVRAMPGWGRGGGLGGAAARDHEAFGFLCQCGGKKWRRADNKPCLDIVSSLPSEQQMHVPDCPKGLKSKKVVINSEVQAGQGHEAGIGRGGDAGGAGGGGVWGGGTLTSHMNPEVGMTLTFGPVKLPLPVV